MSFERKIGPTYSKQRSPSVRVSMIIHAAAVTASLLAAAICTAAERPEGLPEKARWEKVDRIVDGDTIVLMDRTRIRLHGIDAPEKSQPYGSESSAALEEMVKQSVYLLEVDVDRYGRVVGQLYHSKEGYDINASLVCGGFAWWYERYAPNSKILQDCQSEAQQASKGLWRSESPMPPWEWRRR